MFVADLSDTGANMAPKNFSACSLRQRRRYTADVPIDLYHSSAFYQLRMKALEPEQVLNGTALNLLGVIVIAVMLIISSGALFT